jgi:hypothetical protein
MTHHRRRSPTGVSRETLEEAPRRVFAFLCGVAGAPLAHAVLRKHGYTAAQHQRGWELLQQAVGSIVDDTVVDQTSVEALAELDAWDEQGIALIGAHLTRYPAIRDRVLSGLTAATGVEAMLNVKTLLDRLDGLEADDEGRAALAHLSKRSFDESERGRLRKLVDLAQSLNTGPDDDLFSDEDRYLEALVALREWHEEWATVARVVIKRRDHLIRLGLAERRLRAGESDPS